MMKDMNIIRNIANVKTVIGYCLLVFGFASCADLDYTEETTRDEEWTYNYFGDGIKNLVFDVYAQVYNNEFDANTATFLAGATDEAQFAFETGAVNNYVNGGWSPANPITNTWAKAYTAIADVNMYLEKIDQADISDWQYNPDYKNWMAQMETFPYELRFLRAYFYFELFKTYGDVPLVTTTLTNGQANNIHRTPAEDIVEFIVDECDAIAPYLPVTYTTEYGSEVGRATRVPHTALCCLTPFQSLWRQGEVATCRRCLQVYPRQCRNMGTEAQLLWLVVGSRRLLQPGVDIWYRARRKQQL